MESGVKEVGLL